MDRNMACPLFLSARPTSRGARVAQKAPLVQDEHAVAHGQRLLEPVLRQDDGRAQLAVDPADRCQKLSRRDGV
jgi:hypothetical protein